MRGRLRDWVKKHRSCVICTRRVWNELIWIILFLDYYHTTNMIYIHFCILSPKTHILKQSPPLLSPLSTKKTPPIRKACRSLLTPLLSSSTSNTLLTHTEMSLPNYNHKMFVTLIWASILGLHKPHRCASKMLEWCMLPSSRLVFHPLSLLIRLTDFSHLFLDILITGKAL